MPHALNWFEIPVTDFTRAKAFYETVLGISIEPMAMGPTMMGMLSTDPEAVGGAIVQGEGGVPSQSGTMVYLNGGDDLGPVNAMKGDRVVSQRGWMQGARALQGWCLASAGNAAAGPFARQPAGKLMAARPSALRFLCGHTHARRRAP